MNSRIPESPPTIYPVPPNVKRPLWSVMIPVYNCYPFISFCLQSVLMQDPGEELMQIEVIDDFSTDGDVEALVREIGKGRVKYFRQASNSGSLRNFETAIQRSKGYRVHLLHGDDGVKAGFYAEIDHLFSAFPAVGAAFTKSTHIDELGKESAEWPFSLLEQPGIIPDFLEQAAQALILQPPSIVLKREVYENLGSFYGVHYGEDWEMWTRLGSKYEVAYSPVTLALYRSGHGTNITSGSVLSGQNIRDIDKIIGLAQKNLPSHMRRRLEAKARKNFSISYAMASYRLYPVSKKVAFIQAKGALQLSRNIKSVYWVCRLLFRHLGKSFTK